MAAAVAWSVAEEPGAVRAARARRNELVEQAVPLARVIVNAYCREHGVFGLHDEIEAEALAALVTLAESYRPRAPWPAYVNRNLEYRLIDAMRRRSGRSDAKHYERRARINDAEALDTDYEVVGEGDPAFAELETADALAYLGRHLPRRTCAIIERRLEGRRLDDIGRELGISESRVSQILGEARPMIEGVLSGRGGPARTGGGPRPRRSPAGR